jgi:hypothetical protein
MQREIKYCGVEGWVPEIRRFRKNVALSSEIFSSRPLEHARKKYRFHKDFEPWLKSLLRSKRRNRPGWHCHINLYDVILLPPPTATTQWSHHRPLGFSISR